MQIRCSELSNKLNTLLSIYDIFYVIYRTLFIYNCHYLSVPSTYLQLQKTHPVSFSTGFSRQGCKHISAGLSNELVTAFQRNTLLQKYSIHVGFHTALVIEVCTVLGFVLVQSRRSLKWFFLVLKRKKAFLYPVPFFEVLCILQSRFFPAVYCLFRK